MSFAYWLFTALGTFLGVMILLTIIGLFLRASHEVTRAIFLQQAPETIWQVIRDFAATHEWHPLVVDVTRQPDQNGNEVWRERYQGNYSIVLETTAESPPNRLTRSIADVRGPFQGRWEFNITPLESGSRVSITEHGTVRNPFFRFMARSFMKPEKYLEIYLVALAKKFGEEPVFEQHAQEETVKQT